MGRIKRNRGQALLRRVARQDVAEIGTRSGEVVAGPVLQGASEEDLQPLLGSCAICIRMLAQSGPPIKTLPCGHHFHEQCISDYATTMDKNIDDCCPECVTATEETHAENMPPEAVPQDLLAMASTQVGSSMR